MLGGAEVWGPLGYGVGARGTRKARFKGPQSQGQRGLEVWHRGTALVPVPPAEAEGGASPRVKPRAVRHACAQVLGAAWCSVGRGQSQPRAAQCRAWGHTWLRTGCQCCCGLGHISWAALRKAQVPQPFWGFKLCAGGGPVCSLHCLCSEAARSPSWLNNKLRKQEPAGSVN